MKKLLVLLALISFGASALDYNAVDRYKLMEDKYKLQDFLNEDPDHYHIIGLGAGINLDILDLLDDIGSLDGDDTAAADLLSAHDGDEHFLRVAAGIEIPLFSFEAWGVKVKPSFNFDVNGGAILGITREVVNLGDLSDLTADLDPTIASCVNQISTANLTAASNDIVLAAEYACSLPAGTFSSEYGKYYAPAILGAAEAFLSFMTKVDAKGMFNFNLSKGAFFGRVGFGSLFRSDFSLAMNAETLASEDGLSDNISEVTLNGFVIADLQAGYKTGIFSVLGGIEEIKLARAVDKSDEEGELKYGTPVLMRLHGQADLHLASFNLRPYIGMTRRSGYSFIDGTYVGADLGIHFLNDRFGMGLRGMIDKNHITLGVQPRLGIIQLNLLGKIPVATEVDGVKPPTMVSLDLSIFI